MTIREFVKKSFEYDHYRKHGIWRKYTVYHVWNKEWEGAKIGFPHFHSCGWREYQDCNF